MLWGKYNTLSCLITDGDIVINLLICKWKPSRRHWWRASVKMQSNHWKGENSSQYAQQASISQWASSRFSFDATSNQQWWFLHYFSSYLSKEYSDHYTAKGRLRSVWYKAHLGLKGELDWVQSCFSCHQEYLVTFGIIHKLEDKLIWLQWHCDGKYFTDATSDISLQFWLKYHQP